jgi:hypothetical protein
MGNHPFKAMPVCRICNRTSPSYKGLHRHVTGAHKVRALEYYLQFPEAMEERLLATSEVVAVRDHLDPCWEWAGLRDVKGYARMRVAGADTSAGHRLALLARGEVVAQELYVLHACDNPPCVNPAHLRGDTPKENARERSERGRSCHGADHHKARLGDDGAFLVRAEAYAGFSHQQIATRHGISKSSVTHIIARRNYAHVAEPDPDVFLW